MRNLSSSLLASQKRPSRVPYVEVNVTNKVSGVVRLDWTRLYTGGEPEYRQSAVIAGDGSLVRIRVSPPDSGQVLYRQRIVTPGLSSAFGQWTDTGYYGVLAAACCGHGADVSILFIDVQQKLQRLQSHDYGITWGAPELIDYVPSTAVYGITAGYKPDGSLAVFHIDQSTLFFRLCSSGTWQNPLAWDKSTGDLSGVACLFDRDWNLLVTGKDTSGNGKAWSLVYGSGGDIPSGTWSPLREMASAPAGENYEFLNPCLDKTDTFRCFYMEKFTGSVPYNRPFWAQSLPGTPFWDNLWREPVPFDLDAGCAPALVHDNNYAWLCVASGVWRASRSVESFDLTAAVISLKEELGTNSGKLVVELDNSTGRYTSPGTGALSLLETGCQVEFSPGLRTSAGNEISPGPTFNLESYEHVIVPGNARLFLYAFDGWEALKRWQARFQFRWNCDSDDMNVKQILEFVLARTGLRLEVRSQSPVINSFYPDFTIQPDTSGESVVRRLLSLVPDAIFIEGSTAHLINPLASDASVYGYGTAHTIFEGKFRTSLLNLNWVQVEGYDKEFEAAIMADSFNWTEIGLASDRLYRVADRNIGSIEMAQARGEACLRKAEIESPGGYIRVPVNCGQQLYDVIDITVEQAGMRHEKRRVLGIDLRYTPSRGEYDQKLLLGSV